MGAAVATGVFTLVAVLVGTITSIGTQLYLQKTQELRDADRAKQLVAGELLHAQIVLRGISEGKHWPPLEDVNAFLPTSAWQENRSSLAGKIDEDLWNQLVMAYALLEVDRARFAMVIRLPPEKPLPAKEAEGIKKTSNKLGCLRRELGGGGGWLDEIDNEFKHKIDDQIKPRVIILNDSFKRLLDGLSDDDLKKDAVVNEVKQRAEELGELNRALGDNGAWLAETNDELKRRLDKVNDEPE